MATTAEVTKALGVRSGVVKPEYVNGFLRLHALRTH